MNGPGAVAVVGVLFSLLLILGVLIAEACAATTAERLAEVADDDDPLFGQDDPCLEPNIHALQGCERCQNVIAACCLFAFDESLAKLWQAEGQQP